MVTKITTIAAVLTAIVTIITTLLKVHKVLNKFEKTMENSVTKQDLDEIAKHNVIQDESSRCIIRH